MYSSVQSWQMRRHEAREFGPFRLLSARRRHAWHGDEPIPRDSRASRSGIGCRRASVSVAILRVAGLEAKYLIRLVTAKALFFVAERPRNAEGAG